MPTAATAPLTVERPTTPAAAPREQRLTAPADASGAALVAFALQVRRAVQQGRRVVVVDGATRAGWSPGHLLVLERVRDLVERCGGRWNAAAGR